MKKTLFVIVASLLICAQIFFIIALRGSKMLVEACAALGLHLSHDLRDGVMQEFLSLYLHFGVEPTVYTKFMFSVVDWWWILPLVGALLVFRALRPWSGKRAALALFVNMASICALFMAPYSTVFFMGAVV
ncbi:MAG: hypothetical protein LBO00_10420 [Zoogloeaceae bacterium]|jgi:hypothetical protein|nr:hypothetical protein [Zoogloeaceae bacterium]